MCLQNERFLSLVIHHLGIRNPLLRALLCKTLTYSERGWIREE